MSGTRFADSWFRAFATLLVTRRKLLFALMTIVVVGGLYFAQTIRIDNSLELWFLEGDPALTAYREFKEKYGNDEIILAMVDCQRDGMFSPAMLNAVYHASKAIEDDKHNFKRVVSVGLAPYIGLEPDGETMIIEDLMQGPVKDEADAEKIKTRFMDDPFKRRLLQNASSTWAIIIAEPVNTPDMDVRRPAIIEAMKSKLVGFNYRLAGMGVMYDELNQLSIRDGAIFNAVAYAVIATLVFVLYRSWIFLMMVLGAMFFSGMAFLGAYGAAGQNFNMVTVVLPTLMMILSVSDVAYVYNNFCFNSARVREDHEHGLIYVFNEVLSPCLFTSLTNTCGFFALTASSLAVLRVFGVFAGFACMVEYVLSMIVAVFILGFFKPEKELVVRRPMEA
ncbi:MAG: MMPL family transporter, partial [Candidatus Rifleibacteriota bacterium]